MALQPQLASLSSGQHFEGYLLVRNAEERTDKNGRIYYDLNLSDKSGEINGKVWANPLPSLPKPAEVVFTSGEISEFNGRRQLKIAILRAAPQDNHEILSLLSASAPEAPQDMLKEIEETICNFSSEPLRKITNEMICLAGSKLDYFPAAQRVHHAEKSGLLHHTTSMLRAAKAILPLYPFLNAELLLAGVIIHDLCKTEEMESDNWGIVRDYSKEGLLLGHISMGAVRIQQAADAAGVSGETVLLLQHMILSHHGIPEYGSPKQPMFPEAEMLHILDLMDARMNEMQGVMEKVPSGVFSEKLWSLDRRMYHPEYELLDPQTPANDGKG